MFRSIRKETAGILASPVFWISVLGALVLMLMQTYDVCGSMEETETYNMLEMLFTKDRSWFLEEARLYREELSLNMAGRQMIEFVTVVATLPFLVRFCGERNSGVMRTYIFREGRWRYYISKMVSGIVCGGLVVCLAALCLQGLLCMLVPSVSEAGPEKMEVFQVLYNGKAPEVLMAGNIAGMFFYGMAAAVPGCVMAAFSRDVYLCLTLPFLCKYILGIFHTWLFTYLYMEEHELGDRARGYLEALYNNGTLEAFLSMPGKGKYLQATAAAVLMAVAGTVIFSARMNRRRDLGV